METLRVDRGLELNKRRLVRDLTDVKFIVQDQVFFAHRLIVGLHSDYLRLLIDPNLPFTERNNEEITLKGVNQHTFSRLLEYIYTGVIAINDDNVFEIYECCNYLQLRSGDPLADKCLKWMMKKLKDNCNLQPDLLVKMWSFSESFGSIPLRDAVLSYVDRHLEALIESNILAFLGFNEICQIINRPSLCVQQSIFVCSSVLHWLRKKCEPESDEDNEMAGVVLQKLQAKFPFISSHFLLAKWPGNSLAKPVVVGTTCDSCTILSLWSRDEKDICGIAQFLEERKEEQVFLSLTFPGKDNQVQFSKIEGMKNSRSYFQHYGPVNVHSGFILVSDCDSFLFYMAGKKVKNQTRKFLADSLFNEEIYVFEFASMTWLRMSNVLPRRLLHFKALCMRRRLYIVGGYTDIKPPGLVSVRHDEMVVVEGLNLFISRSVYCIHMDDWFSSSSAKWKEIALIPESVTSFSALLNYDNQKLVLVSSDYRLDILDTSTNDWTTIHNSSRPRKNISEGKEVPVAAVAAILGSVLYVISRRSNEIGANPMWVIDLSEDLPVWQPLVPALEMRFLPLSVIAHGGYLYVMGNQTAQCNFLYKFDPVTKDWHKCWENFKGHLSPGGLLLRRQITSASLSR